MAKSTKTASRSLQRALKCAIGCTLARLQSEFCTLGRATSSDAICAAFCTFSRYLKVLVSIISTGRFRFFASGAAKRLAKSSEYVIMTIAIASSRVAVLANFGAKRELVWPAMRFEAGSAAQQRAYYRAKTPCSRSFEC